MADKEERILITKCSCWCHALRVSCDQFDDDDGMFCDKSGKWVRITEKDCAKCKDPVLYGISRQEAIYKMAKALCNMYYSPCSECAFKDKPKDCKSLLKNSDFYEQGEAALDALLSQGE